MLQNKEAQLRLKINDLYKFYPGCATIHTFEDLPNGDPHPVTTSDEWVLVLPDDPITTPDAIENTFYSWGAIFNSEGYMYISTDSRLGREILKRNSELTRYPDMPTF